MTYAASLKGVRGRSFRAVAVSLAAIVGIVAGSVAQTGAAPPIPIEKLSRTEITSGAPAATVVAIAKKGGGRFTTTLGALRAAHAARELALANAGALGVAAAKRLFTKTPVAIGVRGTNPLQTGPPVPRQKTGPIVHNPGQLAPATTPPIVEPSSQYAGTPADMRAFCAAAHASACAYLPPQQQIQNVDGALNDLDGAIIDPQCSQEGGSQSNFGGGPFCWFVYPLGVTVGFTPAPSYRLSQSADCHSPWTYNVDVHGAVVISLNANVGYIVPTGSNPTCVVRVTTGP